MLPIETWLAYTGACILIILAPGPDNVLAISRGISQGRFSALVSSAGAGVGLMVHVAAAVLGLAGLIQTSAVAFGVIKVVGAAYLIWLGIKAIRSKDLVTFSASGALSNQAVFASGLLTNVLNPKPALFILAFVPQLASPAHGAVTLQMGLLGTWFAFLAFAIFAVLGAFSAGLARWLEDHPRSTLGLNYGAGLTFIAAGMSVALLESRK